MAKKTNKLYDVRKDNTFKSVRSPNSSSIVPNHPHESKNQNQTLPLSKYDSTTDVTTTNGW